MSTRSRRGFGVRSEQRRCPAKRDVICPPAKQGELGFVEIDMTVVSVILCPLIALRSTMFGFCNMLCQVASVRPAGARREVLWDPRGIAISCRLTGEEYGVVGGTGDKWRDTDRRNVKGPPLRVVKVP